MECKSLLCTDVRIRWLVMLKIFMSFTVQGESLRAQAGTASLTVKSNAGQHLCCMELGLWMLQFLKVVPPVITHFRSILRELTHIGHVQS
jgi:hypothetical protein